MRRSMMGKRKKLFIKRFYPAGNYTWIVPRGCTSVDVFLVGGGSGAGQISSGSSYGGGGGGYTKTYRGVGYVRPSSGSWMGTYNDGRDGDAITVFPGPLRSRLEPEETGATAGTPNLWMIDIELREVDALRLISMAGMVGPAEVARTSPLPFTEVMVALTVYRVVVSIGGKAKIIPPGISVSLPVRETLEEEPVVPIG